LLHLKIILAVKDNKRQKPSPIDDKALLLYKPESINGIDEILEIFLQNSLNLVHVRNVSLYVHALCEKQGMTEEESDFVAKTSFLHDIGKLLVPVKAILKSGALTIDEYETVKLHTQYGYDLLYNDQNEFLKIAAIIAKQHHERYDGNGYFNLSGDEIHPYARIVCIADVFDAITTEREYKSAWEFEDGFSYIVEHAGSYFSPENTKYFIDCHDELYRIYCMTRLKL